MSFYSKYQELALPDSYVLASMEFNNSILDSGPNSNNPIHSPSSLGFIQSDHVFFTNDMLEFESLIDEKNLTVFIDFEKQSVGDSQIILSNFSGGEGFFFGCASSGLFFVGYELAGQDFLFFFDKIEVSKRSVIILKKTNNFFSLGYYEPFSKTIDYQSIYIPVSVDFDLSTIKIGGDEVSGFSYQQNFKIYHCSILNETLPTFVEAKLCESIITSLSDNFKFGWISNKNQDGVFKVEETEGNDLSNTGIKLPFCSFPSGFSFYPNIVSEYSRFYQNGEYIVPATGYVITPTEFSSTDYVVADFFESGTITGSYSSYTGYTYFPLPKNSACVFTSSNARLINKEDYLQISSINPCYLYPIIFPNTGLTNI